MLSLKIYTLNTPFIYPFTISKGTKTHQPSLVVSLSFGALTGFGEAPAIAYYNVTVANMVEQLQAQRKLIEGYSLVDPERFWHFLHHLFPNNNFLINALDMAAWDLWGKLKRKSIAQFIGAPVHQPIITDYTIGIASQEQMVNKLRAKPWPVYKIKCGSPDDLIKIKALRAITQSPFRLDANAAWTYEQVLDILPELEQLGIVVLEQPLAKDNWQGMEQLMTKTKIPLFADEACVVETDVAKCAGHFNGINIKLTKCGGITPALRMIDHARKLGLQIMLGCMNETSIGSAAMAQLATKVDLIDMDGPLLLAQDVATGLNYDENGVVSVNFGLPGLGIQVNTALLEAVN
jgi:L-Ala-D/L-Glu epimerase